MKNRPALIAAQNPRPSSRIARAFSATTCVFVIAATAAAAAPAVSAAAAVNTRHPLGARPPLHRVSVNRSALGMTAQTVLPASMNLRAYAMPVGDQGQVGSCVTWAIDYGMLGWYSKKLGRAGQPFAPMFTYTQINGGGDNGSYPTDALALAQAQGSDTRAHYTQGDYDWWDQPTNAEKANAAHYKISGWHTLFSGAQAGSVTALKTALATNHPVAITIPVRHGFDYMGSSASSVDTDYSSGIRGYHEILALGYDATGLVVQNSWGTGWGAAGFGKLSWAVVTHDVVEAEDMDGFAPDMATPIVTSVKVAALATGNLSTTMPYKVTWTGFGNIASYHAWYAVNGGAQMPVTLASAKATTYTFNAAPGSTYTFSVQATNSLAQTGDTVTSASFTPTLAQELDGSIAYSGSWTNPAVPSASGGNEQRTTQANASATITTNARAIAWIASRGSTHGSARVYVDGVLKTAVNLYATTTTAKLIGYAFDFGSVGSHTMKIVAVGTAVHPTVDVDAFVVTT